MAFENIDLNAMMTDIVDVFNLEGVELVRLSGLFYREQRISNDKNLTPEVLDKIIHKLKNAGIIHYEYVLYCPHCYEITYQVKKQDNPYAAKRCDTCGQIYIPQNEISLFEQKLI